MKSVPISNIAVAPDTMMLMSDGSKRQASKLSVGDLVAGPGGSPRRVRAAYETGGLVFRIVPTKGMPFVVGENGLLAIAMNNSGVGFKSRTEKDWITGLEETAPRDILAWSVSKMNIARLIRIGVDFSDDMPTSLEEAYRLGESREFWLSELEMTTRRASNEWKRYLLAGAVDSLGVAFLTGFRIMDVEPAIAENIEWVSRSIGVMSRRDTRYIKHNVYLHGSAYVLPVREQSSVLSKINERPVAEHVWTTAFSAHTLREGVCVSVDVGGDGRALLDDFTVIGGKP